MSWRVDTVGPLKKRDKSRRSAHRRFQIQSGRSGRCCSAVQLAREVEPRHCRKDQDVQFGRMCGTARDNREGIELQFRTGTRTFDRRAILAFHLPLFFSGFSAFSFLRWACDWLISIRLLTPFLNARITVLASRSASSIQSST